MNKQTKTLIALAIVAVLLFGLWYLIWIMPNVPVKSVRNYFLSIMEEDYQKAWSYIMPKSEFQRFKGGPTLDYNRFEEDLQKARARQTRVTEVHILDTFTEFDPFENRNVEVVQVQTENLVSGTPKTSDPKNYYLKIDPKDGIWKIYKGVTPRVD